MTPLSRAGFTEKNTKHIDPATDSKTIVPLVPNDVLLDEFGYDFAMIYSNKKGKYHHAKEDFLKRPTLKNEVDGASVDFNHLHWCVAADLSNNLRYQVKLCEQKLTGTMCEIECEDIERHKIK